MSDATPQQAANTIDAIVRCVTGRERRSLECSTCHDIGMIEDGLGREDTCPTCEGGIYRELESWRWFIHRQAWRGWRIDLIYHRIPRVRRERPV